MELTIGNYAETAADTFERNGQVGLVEYIDRIHNESGFRILLFNSQAQNLSNHKMPAGAPALAERSLEGRQPEMASESIPPITARLVVSSRGERYVLVAELPMRRRSGPFGFPGPILHILGVSLVGALSCYGLARYLTSPVKKLRTATRELAQGNLGTRVSAAMGSRQDELASLGADFDLMAEQIEGLVNRQRRLLGDISHELRSPLARLNVALELAKQRAGTDAAVALERIQSEAETLNEMIGQLLALTRLEGAADGLPKTSLDVYQLVKEIVDDADFEARGRNRSVSLAAGGQCHLVGSEQLLRRAIENVVRNAVHYTAEGTDVEVRLVVDSGEACRNASTGSPVQVNSATSNGSERCVAITVRDRGTGVPESALKEIFRPFYRVDEARDREAGGVGLGLAIAERAVRLHGGEIVATNAPGGGLLVTITIPVREV